MIKWRQWYVREKLSNAELTIGQAAKIVGVERQTLSAAINGQREPSLSETVALARLLDVPVDQLLEGDPSPLRPKDRGRLGGIVSTQKIASTVAAEVVAV